MRVFILGASGYIGGSVAAALLARGDTVLGLARSADKADALRRVGIEPVLGSLSDLGVLEESARRADAVINAANADEVMPVLTLIDALTGSGKRLLHTSGTSVVADRAMGMFPGPVFSEDTPVEPLPERLGRVAIDAALLKAAQAGVHSVVIRPSLIYGRGHGLNPHSVQLPRLIALARAAGAPLHVGAGRNVWSHVHIDDVVALYLLALSDAPPGSLFYAENGEASWRDMAAAVGRTLGLPAEPREWPAETALRELGVGAITTYGSNSRVSAAKARRMLGWSPSGPGLFEFIANGAGEPAG